MRYKLIECSMLFGLLVVLSTEALSFLNIINKFSVILLWSIFGVYFIYFYINNIRNKLSHVFDKIKKEKILVILSSTILLVTFFICCFYLPNNGDAMSYRFPRVLMWIQNNNVGFYPTPDQRQLFMAPFSDYLILHIYLLFGNPLSANFVQWFAMLFSLITASLITKELGGSFKTQLLSVFFLVSIPMGILQSTSVQTDYMISFWFLNFIYFLILYKKKPNFKNIIYVSIALGLGILSKQNMYLFSFPFLIIIFYNFKKIEKKLFFKQLLVMSAIVILINSFHLSRTFDLYKNFTSSHKDNINLLNENISPKYIASNLIRNLSFNLTLPNKSYNENLRNLVKKFHDKIEISITDSKNTFGKDFYIYFNTYETHASNTLHFFLFLFCLLLIYIKKIKINFVKQYIFLLAVGLIIFSIFLKWQPTGNRYLLPLFAALAPILALIISNLENDKVKNLIISLFFMWTLPFLFLNHTRPLMPELHDKIVKSNPKEFFLKTKNHKNYMLFTNSRHKEYYVYTKIVNTIKKHNCSNISIYRGYAEFEFPLIFLLKEEINNKDLTFVYSNVRNLTRNIVQNNSQSQCAHIEFKCNKDDINCSYVDETNLSQRFKKEKMSKNINLYILSS